MYVVPKVGALLYKMKRDCTVTIQFKTKGVRMTLLMRVYRFPLLKIIIIMANNTCYNW